MERDKVRFIYLQLNEDNRQKIFVHLKRMAEEEGWHPLQKKAAQAAIGYIIEIKDEKKKR